MKINEVEKALGVPRSAIRFFEKQGLIETQRNESNDYREYTEEDLSRLKTILILRKTGFSIASIRDLLNGSAELDDLLDERINALEKQQEELQAVRTLCLEMKKSRVSMTDFDAEYYWERINAEEKKGSSFFDALSGELQIALDNAAKDIEYSPGHGPRTPDLIYDPLRHATGRIRSFWAKHQRIHVILMICILLGSLAFVLWLSGQ